MDSRLRNALTKNRIMVVRKACHLKNSSKDNDSIQISDFMDCSFKETEKLIRGANETPQDAVVTKTFWDRIAERIFGA